MTSDGAYTPAPSRSLAEAAPLIESLLAQWIQCGRFELKFTITKAASEAPESNAPEYLVDFSGADRDLLVERNGALLDAIEHVILKAVRLDEELLTRITFDCQGWRRLRTEELRLTALMAAERVIETGDAFPLSPMSPRERRIVHLALRDRPEVRTESEGFGPERRVVIHPSAPSAPRPARPLRRRR